MTKLSHCALSLLLLAVASFDLPAQAVLTPESAWTIVREDLFITIDPIKKLLEVSGVLELRLSGKEKSTGPTLGINSRSTLMKWKSLTCVGAEATLGVKHPTRPARRLAQIRFAKPKSRGDRIEVRFACELVKSGRQLVVGSKIALASWVEAWYPIPEPSPGAGLGGATRAKGKTTFNLPKGWSAVTNGKLVSHKEENGRTIEVWSTPRALSRSFAAAPYRRIVHETESLTASLYLLSDTVVNPRAHVRVLGQAILAMQKRWGSYPFRNFSIAEVPSDIGVFGAASEQGFILVKPHFLAVAGGNLPLFAHEAAHAWWGNTVGTDGPGSLLCSESLAQYGAVIAIEAVEGKAAATEFLRFSRRGYIANQCARGYFDLLRAGNDVPLSKLTSSVRGGNTLSDAKGHWVYHMLRRRVGDKVFFATLRGLIAKFDGHTMTLVALRKAFDAAAPKAGLQQFFSQWLDRKGAPVLDGTCIRKEGRTFLELEQRQHGEPFVLDLDVELRLRDGNKLRRRLRVGAAKTETIDLKLGREQEVASVTLDPDHALLLWSPEYGPSPVESMNSDPEISAADRAVYLGDYAVVGRDLVVKVVERGTRLGLIVGGGKQERLLPTGDHAFRSDNGRIRFKVKNGKATALEFRSDGGRVIRAKRR